MLIVAGHLTIDPADIDLLRDAAAVMMAATLAEPGCIEYAFSVKLDDPGRVQIFEVWEDGEALAAHFAMPHMATFQAALANATITGRDLNRYEVASSEPL